MTHSSGNVRVGTKELVAMLTLFVSADIFLAFPTMTAKLGLEAGWMISLISGVIALVIFAAVNAGLKRSYPGHDLIDVARLTMGQGMGVIISVIVGIYFLLGTAAVMRQFMEQIVSNVLENTPLLIIGGLFTIAVSYIAQCGLEGICRTAYILLPIMIGAMILLAVALINWWQPAWLLPLWGSGVLPVLRGGLLYSSLFSNVLLICLIYPHAHEPEKLMRVGVWSIVITDCLLTGFILLFFMVFPAAEGAKVSFPFYELARLIYIGRFMQRLESVFIFLWVSVAVIRISMMLWAAAYSFGRGFKWPSYKPGIPALALLAFALSLVPKSQLEVVWLTDRYLVMWGNLVVFGIPILIVTFGLLRRNRGGTKGGQKGSTGKRRRTSVDTATE